MVGAPVDISVGFSTTLATPGHVAIAEKLGYRRAWLYDTPQQSPDVWMTLALAAERTERIGLGPGVLIPTLRHPMVNAAGTASLVAMAPGRVVVGFGTGFTGRRAMGEKKPMPWAFVAEYVRVYRALLRGETTEWDGATIRMLHGPDDAPARPIEVPIIISAFGPKGHAVAKELGDGLFAATFVPPGADEFSWVSYLCWGTVLDDDEGWDSARAKAAGGPGAVLAYHATYELQDDDAVAALPGGREWLDVVKRLPPQERHFAVHERHCYGLNEADQVAWAAGGSVLLDRATLSGPAKQVRAKLDEVEAAGVTEIVYQPVGDIERELETFIAAARL
jgi:5,10-methylenetetrahydromethanopterin reductase